MNAIEQIVFVVSVVSVAVLFVVHLKAVIQWNWKTRQRNLHERNTTRPAATNR
jgi:hypothetical protein